MQEKENIHLNYFSIFRIWFYANLILSSLFIVFAIILTLSTHDGIYDFETVTMVIAYGFMLTIPSLIVLLLSHIIFSRLFIDKITIYNFYTYVIVFINAVYFLVTEFKNPSFLVLILYLLTTAAGLFSLKIVSRKNKTNA